MVPSRNFICTLFEFGVGYSRSRCVFNVPPDKKLAKVKTQKPCIVSLQTFRSCCYSGERVLPAAKKNALFQGLETISFPALNNDTFLAIIKVFYSSRQEAPRRTLAGTLPLLYPSRPTYALGELSVPEGLYRLM